MVDKIARGNAGRGAHGHHRGNVVSAAVERVQFRLDVHRPRPVRQAEAPGCTPRTSWPGCCPSSGSG